MTSKLRLRPVHGGPTAVTVRLIAFLAATAAIITIPAALIATATGHVSHQSALVAVAAATGLIVFAAVSVRPFDPM